MEQGLILKVYEIDYSFIIKNYLDEKLWEKEWTIFIYKGFQITLKLSSIDVRAKAIYFEVSIQDNNESNKSYWTKSVKDTFKYVLSIDNIDILKQSLNHTIFGLIQKLENDAYIEYTDEFFRLEEMKDNERQELQEIAEEFLDSEGVSNSDIREAYIDYYIDKNEKVYDLRNEYRSKMKYKMITDFYLIFLQATEDKERMEILERKIGSEELDNTLKEIEEYEKYMKSDEFKEDMESNLEEI